MRKRMLKQMIAVISIALVGLGLAIWILFFSSAQTNSAIAAPSVSKPLTPVLDATAGITLVKSAPTITYQTPGARQTLIQHDPDIQNSRGQTILPKASRGDLTGEAPEIQAPLLTLSKTGPSLAKQNDVIVYTIVVTNTGDLAQNVVISDVLPYTGVFVPGSCTYYRQGGPSQPCGPLNQLWQEDLATGDRITTTFSVQVTAGSMNWPMVNCAYLGWGTVQMSSCWTTMVNRNIVYLPLVLRTNDPPSNCYPYLIAEVDAGARAHGVAIDTAGRRAFVASDSGITVIHADTHAWITSIPLPSAFGVAYDPDHDRIWVSRINADRVAVLDGTTYAEVADLPAGGQPRYVAYNPTNDRVYVTTIYEGGTVNVYNAVSPGYERTLTNVRDPGQIAVNPVTNRIYVTNHNPNGQLTVIRGDTHQTYRIASGVFDAFGVTVDTTRNLIYVASVYEGRLSVIDGATEQGLGKVNLERGDGRKVPLLALAFNPDLGPEGHLWLVTSSEQPDGEDQVLLIPNGWPTLGTPVPVDLSYYPNWGIAIDPITDRVWVPIVTDALASVVQDGEPVCTVPFQLSDTGTKEGDEFLIQVSPAPQHMPVHLPPISVGE